MVSHKSGCDFLKFTQIITREKKIAQEYRMIYLIISFICLKNLPRIRQVYLCCIVFMSNFWIINLLKKDFVMDRFQIE
ncbi:hypothetical protein BEI02_17275 [Elizabethkingia sp. HvH-WGS333]|nr:hypothetical protein AMC91_08615 [Elizabethkingia miricola]OIK45668.1 hypothetical protein BEI02_17275 [Elizabethkingia sp. HvH-WGS333]